MFQYIIKHAFCWSNLLKPVPTYQNMLLAHLTYS